MRFIPSLPDSTAKRLRRVLFFVHLWCGAILGLWFAAVGLTGSALAWLPELITYEMKVRHPHEISRSNQPQIPVSQALRNLKQAIPDLKPPEMASVVIPNGRYPFYLVPVRRNGGMVYKIDPYSGKVHPPYRKSDLVIGTIANFHEMLLLETPGLITNGVGAVFGVLMLVSGAWLWWPNTWKQLKLRLTVKRGATPRRLVMDLHNLFGSYLFVILLVSTLTAALLAYNTVTKEGLEKAIDGRAAAKEGGSKEGGPETAATPANLSDDELLERARRAIPDIPVMSIRRALKPGSTFQVSYWGQGGFMTTASLDLNPHTGEVVKLERGFQRSTGSKTVQVLGDLHYGYFGGVTTKLLYTFAGLMPLSLFVTGMLMWWNRKKAERKSAQAKAAANTLKSPTSSGSAGTRGPSTLPEREREEALAGSR